MLSQLQRMFFIMTISIGLLSCVVGPNFHAPAAPHTTSYTGTTLSHKTTHAPAAGQAGKAQHFFSAKDIPAQWWTLFHSPELNELINKGIANSPNLTAAKAALRAAHETTVAQIGTLMVPNVSANLGGQRQLFSNASLGGDTGPSTSIFNLYNASVNVSYTLDVFGGSRRQIEAISAQEDLARYELAAAYLTLTSNITTTVITIASLKTQIQATRELINAQNDQLKLITKQFQLGGAAQTDVLTQQTTLSQTRATLPPLEQSLAQNLHLLSVLVGETPNEKQLAHFNLEKLTLPANLPVTLPSILVQQRPDILAAEATLHTASANVGVATANLLPQFNLSGGYGWQTDTFSQLFKPDSLVWNYGTSILQPIINGGALRAKKRAAVDQFQQSAAQYRQTVLQAFQNVADTLRALQNDAEALRLQKSADASAQRSLQLTTQQYRLGGTDYLSLLTAQSNYQKAHINYIQAKAARYTDTAALFQALGGGWWHERIEG